jgi:hypothetical protein
LGRQGSKTRVVLSVVKLLCCRAENVAVGLFDNNKAEKYCKTGIMIVLFDIAGLCFGCFVYSKFIAEKIFKLDPDFRTPAHEFNDGTDFVPTNKYVLWGNHFTSVAGAAPIVGPA